jgi:hypothetical protein
VRPLERPRRDAGPYALLFAAALLASSSARAGGPYRYQLKLGVPMQTDGGARLAPGTYDVVFEPAPGGGSAFTASYYLGGKLVAKGRAELKGAPPGTKLADVTAKISSPLEIPGGRQPRRDGAVHSCDYDANVKTTLAFFHALLTETGMPELDGASKAPAAMSVGPSVRVAPAALALPTRTPTPKK